MTESWNMYTFDIALQKLLVTAFENNTITDIERFHLNLVNYRLQTYYTYI